MGTRAVRKDRRFKGGHVSAGSQCLYGAARKPKVIVKPAHGIRGYGAFLESIEKLAAEVERIMEEGDEE